MSRFKFSPVFRKYLVWAILPALFGILVLVNAQVKNKIQLGARKATLQVIGSLGVDSNLSVPNRDVKDTARAETKIRGAILYDTTGKKLYYYDGTAFKEVGGAGLDSSIYSIDGTTNGKRVVTLGDSIYFKGKSFNVDTLKVHRVARAGDSVGSKVVRAYDSLITGWAKTDSVKSKVVRASDSVITGWAKTDSVKSKVVRSSDSVITGWMKSDSVKSLLVRADSALIAPARTESTDTVGANSKLRAGAGSIFYGTAGKKLYYYDGKNFKELGIANPNTIYSRDDTIKDKRTVVLKDSLLFKGRTVQVDTLSVSKTALIGDSLRTKVARATDSVITGWAKSDSVKSKVVRATDSVITGWAKTDSVKSKVVRSSDSVITVWAKTDSVKSKVVRATDSVITVWLKSDSVKSKVVRATDSVITGWLKSDSVKSLLVRADSGLIAPSRAESDTTGTTSILRAGAGSIFYGTSGKKLYYYDGSYFKEVGGAGLDTSIYSADGTTSGKRIITLGDSIYFKDKSFNVDTLKVHRVARAGDSVGSKVVRAYDSLITIWAKTDSVKSKVVRATDSVITGWAKTDSVKSKVVRATDSVITGWAKSDSVKSKVVRASDSVITKFVFAKDSVRTDSLKAMLARLDSALILPVRAEATDTGATSKLRAGAGSIFYGKTGKKLYYYDGKYFKEVGAAGTSAGLDTSIYSVDATTRGKRTVTLKDSLIFKSRAVKVDTLGVATIALIRDSIRTKVVRATDSVRTGWMKSDSVKSLVVRADSALIAPARDDKDTTGATKLRAGAGSIFYGKTGKKLYYYDGKHFKEIGGSQLDSSIYSVNGTTRGKRVVTLGDSIYFKGKSFNVDTLKVHKVARVGDSVGTKVVRAYDSIITKYIWAADSVKTKRLINDTTYGGTGYFQVISSFSDIRLKENLVPIQEPIKKINALQGYTYTWKNTKMKGFKKGTDLGLIAQEVEKVMPEVVSTTDTRDKYKTISYDKLVALLIEGIKEQHKIIETQQKQIDTLKTEVKSIKAVLETIKTLEQRLGNLEKLGLKETKEDIE